MPPRKRTKVGVDAVDSEETVPATRRSSAKTQQEPTQLRRSSRRRTSVNELEESKESVMDQDEEQMDEQPKTTRGRKTTKAKTASKGKKQATPRRGRRSGKKAASSDEEEEASEEEESTKTRSKRTATRRGRRRGSTSGHDDDNDDEEEEHEEEDSVSAHTRSHKRKLPDSDLVDESHQPDAKVQRVELSQDGGNTVTLEQRVELCVTHGEVVIETTARDREGNEHEMGSITVAAATPTVSSGVPVPTEYTIHLSSEQGHDHDDNKSHDMMVDDGHVVVGHHSDHRHHAGQEHHSDHQDHQHGSGHQHHKHHDEHHQHQEGEHSNHHHHDKGHEHHDGDHRQQQHDTHHQLERQYSPAREFSPSAGFPSQSDHTGAGGNISGGKSTIDEGLRTPPHRVLTTPPSTPTKRQSATRKLASPGRRKSPGVKPSTPTSSTTLSRVGSDDASAKHKTRRYRVAYRTTERQCNVCDEPIPVGALAVEYCNTHTINYNPSNPQWEYAFHCDSRCMKPLHTMLMYDIYGEPAFIEGFTTLLLHDQQEFVALARRQHHDDQAGGLNPPTLENTDQKTASTTANEAPTTIKPLEYIEADYVADSCRHTDPRVDIEIIQNYQKEMRNREEFHRKVTEAAQAVKSGGKTPPTSPLTHTIAKKVDTGEPSTTTTGTTHPEIKLCVATTPLKCIHCEDQIDEGYPAIGILNSESTAQNPVYRYRHMDKKHQTCLDFAFGAFVMSLCGRNFQTIDGFDGLPSAYQEECREVLNRAASL